MRPCGYVSRWEDHIQHRSLRRSHTVQITVCTLVSDAYRLIWNVRMFAYCSWKALQTAASVCSLRKCTTLRTTADLPMPKFDSWASTGVACANSPLKAVRTNSPPNRQQVPKRPPSSSLLLLLLCKCVLCANSVCVCERNDARGCNNRTAA